MIIDGKAIAQSIITNTGELVAKLPYTPRLAVFTCSPNFETKKFLALKERKAREVGVALQLIEFDNEVTVTEIIMSITQAHAVCDGIVVQLPFPERIDIDEVLPAIMPSHDVDMLTYDGSLEEPLPPVVGAIAAIAHERNVTFKDKKIVVVGRGRLVGAPAALYARSSGAADITILDKGATKEEMHTALAVADIVITGAGVPRLITGEMVKEGVVVFDAGTSESEGVLAGDVDPSVSEKASIFTPVPGGIGPITIAILLKNVVTLAAQHRK